MGGFIGNFANLTNYKIGTFSVEGLVGRDNSGIPRWEVSCGRCGHSQIIGHLRLAPLVEGRRTQVSLQCTYPACLLSKNRNGSETPSEFFKRERMETERQVQAEAEKKAQAEEEWARERAKAERIERVRCEYREFWLDQLNIEGHPESAIPPLKEWLALSDEARQMILERIRQHPGRVWKF